jgi:hypothetical protein
MLSNDPLQEEILVNSSKSSWQMFGYRETGFGIPYVGAGTNEVPFGVVMSLYIEAKPR